MAYRLERMDPLAILIAPPENETQEQRQAREKKEALAHKTSLRIDEELKADKAAYRKKKNCVKVLVLGQSESGKTTAIKNFQIAYANQSWQEERASWLTVVYLNLVRSINRILDILTIEMINQHTITPHRSPISPLSPAFSKNSEPESESETEPYWSDDDKTLVMPPRSFSFSDKHKALKLRLAPLRSVQQDLETQIQLGADGSDYVDQSTTFSPTSAAPFVDAELAANPRRPNEFYIRSNCGWKNTVNKLRPRLSIATTDRSKATQRGKQASATEIIIKCGADMQALWKDSVVHEVLSKHGIRLEELPGFFLDDIERITARDYEPSDNDVLRARLRTMGVQEYRFTIEKGKEIGREWLMFDVGGCRTSRAAWFPFFDDINAIIFMVPLNCYDEILEEDDRVNRLDDSVLIWKAICSTKILANVQLVVFFNKCDLLAKKLRNGRAQVKDHFPTFGDRKQDVKTVAGFFRQEFKGILKRRCPDRPVFTHLTSVTNTKSTAVTLAAVREGIVQESLVRAELL